MMQILLIVAISVSSWSWAGAASFDWTGVWQGQGELTLTSPGSHNRSCHMIGLSFHQTTKQLSLVAGGYECEDISAQYGAVDLKIRDGQLFDDTTLAGDLSADRLDLFQKDPSDGTLFRLQLKRNPNGSLHYTETWTDGTKLEMRVEGDLRR